MVSRICAVPFAQLPSFSYSPAWLKKTRSALQTVFLGANDACLSGSPSEQYVPLEKYISNLEEILSHPMVKEQDPRLILITPPPVSLFPSSPSSFHIVNIDDGHTLKTLKYLNRRSLQIP